MPTLAIEDLVTFDPMDPGSDTGDANHTEQASLGDKFFPWVWRIKSWSCEGNIILGAQNRSFSVQGFSGSYVNEHELIVSPQPASISRSGDGGTAGASATFSFSIFNDASLENRLGYRPSGIGLFFPKINVSGSITNSFGDNISFFNSVSGLTTSPEIRWYHTLTNYVVLRTTNTSHPFLSIGGLMEIKPVSWWPYDPGDGGGPIWDVSTGTQIRFDLPGLS